MRGLMDFYPETSNPFIVDMLVQAVGPKSPSVILCDLPLFYQQLGLVIKVMIKQIGIIIKQILFQSKGLPLSVVVYEYSRQLSFQLNGGLGSLEHPLKDSDEERFVQFTPP